MAWIAFRRSWTWSRNLDPEEKDRRLIALWVLSGGAGLMVSGVFVSILYYPFFWLLCALTILLSPATRNESGRLVWEKPSARGARRRQPASPPALQK